jgi:hypothetical protein
MRSSFQFSLVIRMPQAALRQSRARDVAGPPDFEIYESSHTGCTGRDYIGQAAVGIRPRNARGELTVKDPPVATFIVTGHQPTFASPLIAVK